MVGLKWLNLDLTCLPGIEPILSWTMQCVVSFKNYRLTP